MKTFVYLNLDQVLAIHYDQIESYGGSHGVRDLDLLLSAISRCQTTFADEDLYPDILSKTASLIHSLILNHPFIDGNKRTGIVSGARMLFDNGFILKVSKKDMVNPALKIASK